MSQILKELKQRRKALALTQADMEMRVGMSRQQYQRLEARGNPRLDSLELIAKGLRLELMLIPQEKLAQVRAVLEGRFAPLAPDGRYPSAVEESGGNPWHTLLDDE